MQNFVIAAAILGFAAVFVVPFISGILRGFVPETWAAYLPSATQPAFGTQAILSTIVYGAILAVVLLLLSRMKVRAHIDGVTA
jgi:ABC-type Fe3+ transport system permease subunit